MSNADILKEFLLRSKVLEIALVKPKCYALFGLIFKSEDKI